MPSIHTLVKDIYDVVEKDGWFTGGLPSEFSSELGRKLEEANTKRSLPTLRLSQMGKQCPCALWHSIHRPMEQERFPPWVRIKFTYGHVVEALALAMAKAAGHLVEGEQDEIILDGIKGHRDCVIDGCIVDVKSVTSRGYQHFKDGSIKLDDMFGYLDQLDGYILGSNSDPLVKVKDKGYLLAIDKSLGHMCIYEHTLREENIRKRIRDYRSIVALDRPPACTCETTPEGKSGNIRLGTRASYNAFKFSCWPRLRTFLYSGGPVYLTHVVRKPDVVEVDRYGKIVYNG